MTALHKKNVNINQLVRLDPDGAPVITLTGGKGLTAFDHPFNRDFHPDNDLGLREKREIPGAYDFLGATLTFTARQDHWVWTTFGPYWRSGELARVDQLYDQGAPVSADNLRWKYQGIIGNIPFPGSFNSTSSVAVPFKIFQAATSDDDVNWIDVTTGLAIDWDTQAP